VDLDQAGANPANTNPITVYLSPQSGSTCGGATLCAGQVLAWNPLSPITLEGTNSQSSGTNVAVVVSPPNWSWGDTGNPQFDLQICNETNNHCYENDPGGTGTVFNPGWQFQYSNNTPGAFQFGVAAGQTTGNQQPQLQLSSTQPNTIGPNGSVPITWVSQTGGFGTTLCAPSGCQLNDSPSTNNQITLGLQLSAGGNTYFGFLLSQSTFTSVPFIGNLPIEALLLVVLSTVPNYAVTIEQPSSTNPWPLSFPQS
jgi:hypothetical protein